MNYYIQKKPTTKEQVYIKPLPTEQAINIEQHTYYNLEKDLFPTLKINKKKADTILLKESVATAIKINADGRILRPTDIEYHSVTPIARMPITNRMILKDDANIRYFVAPKSLVPYINKGRTTIDDISSICNIFNGLIEDKRLAVSIMERIDLSTSLVEYCTLMSKYYIEIKKLRMNSTLDKINWYIGLRDYDKHSIAILLGRLNQPKEKITKLLMR